MVNMRLCLSLMTFPFLFACGSLQTSSFKGPGSYVTPSASPTPYNPGEFSLAWPVDKIQITQHFKNPRNPRHQGLDLGGPRGTLIRSAHNGVVVFAGQKFRGYGNMILIEHSGEWATLYAHLSEINVREGQQVSQGETVGKMGRSGRTTGVHLHFELIKDKIPIDPLQFLGSPSNNLVSK